MLTPIAINSEIRNVIGMKKLSNFTLTEQEQQHLVCAIASAMEIAEEDQFYCWARGPFRAFMPHEIMIFVEVDECGGAKLVDFLQYGRLAESSIDVFCDAVSELATRLVTAKFASAHSFLIIDAKKICELLNSDGMGVPDEVKRLQNIVIHHMKFISGVSFFVLLIDVPHDRVDRSLQLMMLISSHLKMALSQVLSSSPRRTVLPLTQRELEILGWMRDGKSNREIGEALNISQVTVKNHVTKIFRKLNVQTRTEAVSFGLVAGGMT